ncbi:14083_t:CDS:2 [Funneliformis geosporum]|nr:14083_t:CDS:2 [Funneliformis geosporum]
MTELSNPNSPKQQLMEQANIIPVRLTSLRLMQVRSELNKKNQIAPNAISQHSAINKKECAQKHVAEYTT